MKAAPPAMVPRIHFTAVPRRPRAAAATAMTMVKLLKRSTTVMIVEKMMEGENGNGRGQSAFARRR